MAEQPRLDVIGSKLLAEQGIVEQIDLADREIIRRTPIAIEQFEISLLSFSQIRHRPPPLQLRAVVNRQFQRKFLIRKKTGRARLLTEATHNRHAGGRIARNQ
jgi:hypothetical protein